MNNIVNILAALFFGLLCILIGTALAHPLGFCPP